MSGIESLEAAYRELRESRPPETETPSDGTGEVRTFETGATRDTDEGKLAFEGFLSPRVLLRFAEYMHEHRIQSDGGLRDADNWQKGIPVDAYMDSLLRHIMDLWLHHRGDGELAREDVGDALCACLFNVQGLLFEATRREEYEYNP